MIACSNDSGLPAEDVNVSGWFSATLFWELDAEIRGTAERLTPLCTTCDVCLARPKVALTRGRVRVKLN